MESHLENESTLPSPWLQEKMMQGFKGLFKDEDYSQFEEYLKLEKICVLLSI